MRVAVIIPARNEALALGQVLSEIPSEAVHQVIVVDNGSTDGTAQLAEELGAQVVSEPTSGYGRACRAGLAALDQSIDTVVFMDGDHSDYPEELSMLLEPIANGQADLVIGSRALQAQPGSLTLQQRFGNRLACWLIRRFFRFRYTDLGPFRAIRRDALARLHMQDQAFGWTVEMQAKAVLHGLRIVEVPVRYRRRIGRSKISGTVRGTILAGAAIISMILKTKVGDRSSSGRALSKRPGQRVLPRASPTSSAAGVPWPAMGSPPIPHRFRRGAPRPASPAESVSTQQSGRLLIFLKEPVPGQVKTRLAEELGDHGAAAVYRAATELTLGRLNGFQKQAMLVIDPPEAIKRIRRWVGAAWAIRPQQGTNLGERLSHATIDAFREGAKAVVVIGTDSPWLRSSQIAEAFQALARAEVVIGPTDDGGYYLIGLSKPAADLFAGIAWSSPQVYAQTLANAQALGLSVHVLPQGYDLDYPKDVERFLEEERTRDSLTESVQTIERIMSQRRVVCQS